MTANLPNVRWPQGHAAKVDFLGLAFDNYTGDQVLDEIRLMARQDRFSYVVTPNVDHVVRLTQSNDAGMEAAYRDADIILCDSRILASLARWSGVGLHAIPGSDLTRNLLRTENAGLRLAVVGGDPVLHSTVQRLYPHFEWAFHQPPMGLRQNPSARLAIAEFVENAAAAVIFFAIGAPQSEITCREIAARGRAKGVALCIGASLEFIAGAKKRAPEWMQRMTLEWLYRLGSEPGRLWRRYLVEGPKIFLIWWRWRLVRGARLRGESGSKPSGGT